MSDRQLRKSTLNASERLKQRQETKQLLKDIKKRRTAYSEAITESEQEISQLEKSTISNPSSDTEDWVLEISDSDDEYIDPLRAVKSPNKSSLPSEGSQIQGHSPSPGSWSQVNQFFPEGCVTTPVVLPGPSPTSRSVTQSLPSPRLNLETIVEVERDEVFDQHKDSSEETFDNQTENPQGSRSDTTGGSYREEIDPNYNTKMDTNAYNEKLAQITSEIGKVDRKRESYTKDDANEYDHAECHVKLQKIEDAEEICQDKIFDLITELDENVEADEARIRSLRSLSDELKKRVKTNAKEVKDRMVEILKEKEENKPMSAFERETLDIKKQELESKRADAAKRAASKSTSLMQKIEKCQDKAESLISKLNEEKDIEEMSEQEIRKSILIDLKEWKAVVDDIKKAKDVIDEEAIGVELNVPDQESVESLETECKRAVDLYEQEKSR